jgi:hypothetical protein
VAAGSPEELDARRVRDGRIPDGDTVPYPGHKPWRDLLNEPTELIPVLDEPVERPYLSRLFRWPW